MQRVVFYITITSFFLLFSLLGLSINNACILCRNDNATFLIDQQNEFATISVSSTPENGMTIFLNDINTGKVTPAVIENVPFGKHKVKLVHSHFRTQEKEVVVSEAKVYRFAFEMIIAFAELKVTTNPDAVIYINGSIRGSGTWTGRMGEGVHKIRVEKEGHISRQHDVTIIRDRNVNIDLMMTQKTGTLDITTDPLQAMISLNGRMYGLSPIIIPDLPFGEYTITLEKQEFTSVMLKVSVTDTKVQKLDIPLMSGKEVTIKSNPSGAAVTINQENKGVTPLTIWLKFGTYMVKLDKGAETIVENILVQHAGKKEFVITLKKSVDPFDDQMIFVKGGSFKMGDTFGDGNWEEKPAHPVTVNDFYIGKYEVTQLQWQEIMGNNPSHFSDCNECPVERVSWLDVQEFIAKLNELTGKQYRLPSEAEWEYAAKGGEHGKGYKYAGRNNINFVSWFSGNSNNKTQPVGQKQPNELGLYDMSGNVWEWVNDWFGKYSDSPKINPQGPEEGDFRIVKGGSWFGYIGGSRVSCRGSDDPSYRRSYIGFRVALSPKTDDIKPE